MLLILVLFSLTLSPLATFPIATRTSPFNLESIDPALQAGQPKSISHVVSSKNVSHMTRKHTMGGARQNSVENKNCSGTPPTVEIALMYDQALCDMFSENTTLVEDFAKELVKGAEDILRPKTCIRLSLRSIESRCLWGKQSINPLILHGTVMFTVPTNLSECANRPNNCSTASLILKSLREQLIPGALIRIGHDAVVLLTGRQDGTGVAGATYANSVCDDDKWLAWMEVTEGPSRTTSEMHVGAAVLAHEIGHLLGAPHDATGVMRQKLSSDGSLALSDESADRISKFTEKDPRAWCLFRKFRSTKEVQEEEEWSIATTGSARHQSLGIHVGIPDSHGGRDIHVLFGPQSDACFSIIPLKDCPESGKCDQKTSQPTECFNLPLICDLCAYDSIALRTSTTQGHDDVIVSFTKSSASGEKSGHFLIGHREDGGRNVTRWSEQVDVQYAVESESGGTSLETTKWVSTWHARHEYRMGGRGKEYKPSSMATGSISHPSATDMLWLFPTNSENGRVSCSYIVALDLDIEGNPRKGWGKAVRVPGRFGADSVAFEVAIGSISGSDLPDIIISYQHYDANPTSADFVIGLDLNSTGYVTGGWSQFKSMARGSSEWSPLKSNPMDNSYVESFNWSTIGFDYHVSQFGIGIAELRPNRPSIVRSVGIYNESTSSLMYSLISSEDALEGMHYEFNDVLTAELDFSPRCYECYNGDVARKCGEDLKICESWLDRVYVDTPKKSEQDTAHNGAEIKPLLRMDRQRQHRAKSIECEGFDDLYQRKLEQGMMEQGDGCDLTDFRQVMGYGVLRAFEKFLNETAGDVLQVEKSKVYSSVDNGGVNGKSSNRKAATVTVITRNGNPVLAIRKAIKKLKKHRNDFNRFFMPVPKVKHVGGNRFYVSFFYKKEAGEYL